MNKYWLLIILLVWFPVAEADVQDIPISIFDIKSGDIQGFRDVVDLLDDVSFTQVNLVDGDNGETVTTFRGVAPGAMGALPNIVEGRLRIVGKCTGRCTVNLADDAPATRLMYTSGVARLELVNLHTTGFRADAEGGVISVNGSSELIVRDVRATNNYAATYGGASSINGSGRITLSASYLSENEALIFGNDLDINSFPTMGPAATIEGTSFVNFEGTVSLENPFGNIRFRYTTLNHEPDGIDSTGGVSFFGSVFDNRSMAFPFSENGPGGKTRALCNDFGSGAFSSEGFNVAADNSCSLDQDTDLPNTDPMLGQDADGFLVPMAGSPLIDSGVIDAVVFDGDTLASLPCGHRDAKGTARPQDANNDGVFECDRGAIEVVGGGAVVAGHSSVFYNPERNGEGNYVEVLEDGRAVVYTFTYNPDGTAPAWFLGVGEVSGNSIILDDLFRPTGTPFGDDFDAAEVEFTNAGSMSMVFPDCQATAPGGNIAYTGDVGLGYEGLISRGTRLAHITGCGGETPDPNAGLSGSFYDPARNGEGLIVEWLSNGDILAVFFTYDTEGNQFWLFGQATPNGKSVTMNAVYPSAFTPWGRNFNPNDVVLDNWGTFTLNWTDCNTMSFQYSSTVGTFGSATRNYTRLSKLAGTTCPDFP